MTRSSSRHQLFLIKVFLNLHETYSGIFRHSKISKHKTAKLNCRVKPECSMEPKTGDKVGEQLREGRHTDRRGDQDEGGSCAAEFCREDLTDDDLEFNLLYEDKDILNNVT